MSNIEHVQKLLSALASSDCLSWNQWRKENPDLVIDLRGASLRNSDLRGADLSAADLRKADLSNASLTDSKLGGAKLEDADLSGADLSGADLKCAHLKRADLTGANLSGADMRYADFRGTNFMDAAISDARLEPEALRRAVNVPQPHKKQGRKAKHVPRSPAHEARASAVRGWLAAATDRLSKLRPPNVKHEELTTLQLSSHGNPQTPPEIQPADEKKDNEHSGE